MRSFSNWTSFKMMENYTPLWQFIFLWQLLTLFIIYEIRILYKYLPLPPPHKKILFGLAGVGLGYPGGLEQYRLQGHYGWPHWHCQVPVYLFCLSIYSSIYLSIQYWICITYIVSLSFYHFCIHLSCIWTLLPPGSPWLATLILPRTPIFISIFP